MFIFNLLNTFLILKHLHGVLLAFDLVLGCVNQVRFMRKEVNGTLYVDDEKVATGRAPGDPTVINGLEKFFLGGTPETFDAKRVPVSDTQFLLLLSNACQPLGRAGADPSLWGWTQNLFQS